eukprot:Opistho-2@2901
MEAPSLRAASPDHVREILWPATGAVLHRARPSLSLHERAAPRCAGASAVRRARWWRLRAAHRRDRGGQDHGLPLLPGADPQALQCGLYLQPQADGQRAPAHHLRGVPHRRGACGRGAGAGHGQVLPGPAQRVSAEDPCGGAEQCAHHRRGAEPGARGAGAVAPADQSGDQRAQAVADRADRPARAARHAGPTRAGTAGPARDRALSSAGPVRGRDGAVCSPSPGRGRPERAAALRWRGAAPHPPPGAGRAAAHQSAVRPGLAGRLCPWPFARRPRHRRPGRSRGLRCRRTAGPSRRGLAAGGGRRPGRAGGRVGPGDPPGRSWCGGCAAAGARCQGGFGRRPRRFASPAGGRA